MVIGIIVTKGIAVEHPVDYRQVQSHDSPRRLDIFGVRHQSLAVRPEFLLAPLEIG